MTLLASVEGFPTPGGPLDLDVRGGEVVLLRGPNGSGKTSLLRALAGLAAPLVPRRVTATRAAFAPQHAEDALCGLTVEGEMRLRRRGVPIALAPFAERDVATLSSGEARRVALAAADGAAPLLLLDEPVEGLDAEGRALVRARVAAVAASGGAVVAAEHGALLDDVATRVVELAPGVREPLARPPRPSGASVLVAPAHHARGLAFAPLALPAGFHALVGPNGCGKTTRLVQLARSRPGARLAWADPRGLFTKPTVAAELSSAADHDALVPAPLLSRHPLTLSGGEAQRVSLAKALGRPASVVLLDEPDAHLDAQGRRALLDAIALRVKEGACVLAATHDAQLESLADVVVRMEASA